MLVLYQNVGYTCSMKQKSPKAADPADLRKLVAFKIRPSLIARLKAEAERQDVYEVRIFEAAMNEYLEKHSPGNAGEQPGGKADR